MFVEQVLEGVPASLSPLARLLLVLLGDKLGENRSAWPSMATLGRLAGCSERTARRAIRELEEADMIRTAIRFTKAGDRDSNGYEIPIFSGPVKMTPPPGQNDPTGTVKMTPPPGQNDRVISPSESPHLNIPCEEEGGSSAVASLLRGYQTRYERLACREWGGHSAAITYIADVARWAERQATREGVAVAVVVERWLESVFDPKREALARARWPWRKLAEDPARDYDPPKAAPAGAPPDETPYERQEREKRARRALEHAIGTCPEGQSVQLLGDGGFRLVPRRNDAHEAAE